MPEDVKVEGRVTEGFNPYREVRGVLGVGDEEETIRTPYGAASIRAWRCGCTVARRAELNLKDGVYHLYDEYIPCREHRWIAERLRGLKGG